jgi:N-acetylglucosamine malate deacetylase 2
LARILYVFPHPDDESFGPGPVLAIQRRQGYEVYLLTLTKGEATKQRGKFGYSKDEMGEVRYREMQEVAHVLDLTDLTVLDFEDGELSELDPLVLEEVIRQQVERVKPNVIVTYAIHGISGHRDHLAGHAVVKQVYSTLRRDGASYLKRLALFTLPVTPQPGRAPHLKGSPEEAIDCIVPVDGEALEKGHAALRCYKTYQDVVIEHDPLAQVADGVCFEFFQEDYTPPVNDLFACLDV